MGKQVLPVYKSDAGTLQPAGAQVVVMEGGEMCKLVNDE